MQDKGKTFGTMAANLIAYLRRLGYQRKTITAYGYRLRHLEKMLPEGSETVFNHEAWETIITAVGENRIWAVTEPYRRSLLHTADALFELQMTGTVEIHHKSRRTMDGPDGLLPPEMASFLKALGGKCYQPHTIGGYRTHLAKFQEYLASGRKAIADIHTADVLGFVSSLSGCSEPTRYRAICCLRVFLRHLHDTGSATMDFSLFVPRTRIRTTEKIPSTYHADEIRQILEAIDTANPVGKRDYAILLLIARTGLRASDVSNLEFPHIDWDRNIIRITQWKTGRQLQLPLLPDAGNAIITYLRHGRPESTSTKVFLQARPRFGPLPASAVGNIFQNMARRGGVLAEPGRKHGPHAFRHSLVSELLARSVPFPIVTQVLGHAGGDTTFNSYARIGLQSLSVCALDVPPVPGMASSLFTTEGGLK
jgi:site-specific recombinase XerD